ncbi:MAG: DUF2065 domain-containing protein [Thiotrichales bacterium]
MNWSDLWAAFALVLVIEGLLPFISPDGYKRSVEQLQSLPGKTLRLVGLSSMALGVVLLYLVRG